MSAAPDHKYCNLRSKSVQEISDLCKAAVERKDWTEAYHCAEHHVLLCHPVLTKDQIDFLSEKIPGGRDTFQNMTTHHLERFPSAVLTTMPNVSGAGFQTEMLFSVIKQAIKTAVMDANYIGQWVGSMLTSFVASKGEGCVFSMIDEDICHKEMN